MQKTVSKKINSFLPRIKNLQTSILIIGTGGAGISTAIRLFEDGQKNILLIGDCTFKHAHTEVAEGGVNAAFGNMDNEPDTPYVHIVDTFLEGHAIANPQMVEILGKQAPLAIKRLIAMGADFHKEKNGKISQRYFGAHTYRRTIFKGDETGKEIMRVLCKKVNEYKIPHIDKTYISKLLLVKNVVKGAIGFSNNTAFVISAPVIILATGGYSNVYERSTQRQTEGYGEGIAMAFAEGATIADMEMVQFHPTGLLFPKEHAGELVTEAVRGEGGILTNALGERYMKKYSPQKMELSTRDVVARSSYMEIIQGRGTKHGGVYLDITMRDKNFLLERLPKMYKMLKKFNKIDISKQKMEIAPTAHYTMGGILVNEKTCQTSIKNLFAVGECTDGVHGANRLGGNSLAEILVFGDLLGKYLAKKKINPQPVDRLTQNLAEEYIIKIAKTPGLLNPQKIIAKIRKTMWLYAGIVRTEKKLLKGLDEIKRTRNEVLEKKLQLTGSFVQNAMYVTRVFGMLDLAEATLLGALERKESRGAHYREDYSNKNDKDFLKNIVFYKKNGKIHMIDKSVKKPSANLKKALEAFEKTTNYGHVE